MFSKVEIFHFIQPQNLTMSRSPTKKIPRLWERYYFSLLRAETRPLQAYGDGVFP